MTAIPVENTRLVEELPDVITSTPGLTADDLVILSKTTTDPNAGDYKLTLFDLIIWLYNDAALTGYATAPTQITEVNDDSIATTAFVQNRLAEVTNNYLGTDSVVDALTSTDSTVPLSANQGHVIWQWLVAIEDVLGSKLPISDYNDYYKGLFASEAALNAALPDIGISGSYAIVDQGPGNPAKLYVWDADLPDGQHWVPGGDITPSSTDSLAEGAIKLYFTTQRAIDAGASAFIRYDLAQTLTGLQQAAARANIGLSDTDGLAEGSTNLYFEDARAIAAGAGAFVRYDQEQTLLQTQIDQVLTNLGLLGLNNNTDGKVRLWQPETDYFAETVDGKPAEIVSHNGDLYVVVHDFSSGLDFSVVDAGPSDLALRRLRAVTDIEYIEITASAIAPVVVGQRVGQYLCSKRGMDIFLNHMLPVPEVNNNLETLHVAKCNTGIDGPVVINIKRCNHGGFADQVIGTITIANDNTSTYNYGEFAFNDPWSAAPTTQLWLGNWDMIYFELSTVPTGLDWIAITMLGQTNAYDDPSWNLPV